MASFEAEGTLYKKENTQQITDTFKKREFVIEIVDGTYTQLVKFQLVQDNCNKLDGMKKDEPVKVTFNLRGREWTDPKGEVKYFNSLDAWKVERIGAQQSQPEPQQETQITNAPVNDSGDDLPF